MSFNLKLSTIIPASRPEVFNYFTDSVLLEMWSYPQGVKLKVPCFKNNLYGRYRYEYTQGDDIYICEGVIEGYETSRRIMTLEQIENSRGEVLCEQLMSDILFLEDAGGCKIEITQEGIKTKEEVEKYKMCWEQCLNRLSSLFIQLQESSPV